MSALKLTSAHSHLIARPLWQRALHGIGAPLHDQIEIWRTVFSLFGEVLRRLPRKECWRWPDIFHSTVQIGVGSLPIIAVSTSFAGLVVTNEIAWHMDRALHTIQMIPGFTGQFILRELGIAVPACLLVAKVGAAITAEVGSMKVTEQLDALKLLRIDPITYLVFPRFIAAVVSGACLTLIAIGVTMTCAISIAVSQYGFSTLEYLNALRHFVGLSDVLGALIKGTVFGAIIPIISCAYGFECKGGAEGVGTATTNSVVAATISVIILDFLMTYVFTLFLY